MNHAHNTFTPSFARTLNEALLILDRNTAVQTGKQGIYEIMADEYHQDPDWTYAAYTPAAGGVS